MFVKRLEGSIWDNNYVCDLGIEDHMEEIQIIDRKYKELKNTDTIPEILDLVSDHKTNELMDLYIILNEKFSSNPEYYSNLMEERLNKFRYKEKFNENT